MIVCDSAYMRELERRMKAARKALAKEVADAIDREIETIEAQGDSWYSTVSIALAFRIDGKTLWRRISHPEKHHGFQGHLRRLPLRGNNRDPYYGSWFAACAVNKDSPKYRTWKNPEDAVKALAISHRLNRYADEANGARWSNAQVRIDKWRLENGNDENGNETRRK